MFRDKLRASSSNSVSYRFELVLRKELVRCTPFFPFEIAMTRYGQSHSHITAAFGLCNQFSVTVPSEICRRTSLGGSPLLHSTNDYNLIDLCTYDASVAAFSWTLRPPFGILGQKPPDPALAARAGDIERSSMAVLAPT